MREVRNDVSKRNADPQCHRDPHQPLDHRRLLRAAAAVRSFDVPSPAVLALRIVRRRPVDAGGPSLDRGRAAAELRRHDRAVLARQPVEQGRHRLDARYRPRADEPGGGRARDRPLQCRPEVRLLVDGTPGPGAVLHGHRDLGGLFFVLYDDRAAKDRRPDPLPGGRGGDHHLDHPCLRGDLDPRLGADDDTGLCHAGLGLGHHRKWLRRLAATGSVGPRPRAGDDGRHA
jgi:hypothetical protein